MSVQLPIRGIVLDDLVGRGLYRREVQERTGPNGSKVLWDPISDAPMSTKFAISRFFLPMLAERGWALFVDSDVLFRAPVNRIFDNLDDHYAVYCVKHPEMPEESGVKMSGQIRVPYKRKNWSSVVCWNCDHPANKALTLNMLNSVPGRDLHRFSWLDDNAIGELGPEWNYLVNVSPEPPVSPRIAHFTLGVPTQEGCSSVQYADEWWTELGLWARG
jgi:lipopolysaccharide biosynthesis glycosyltransferase